MVHKKVDDSLLEVSYDFTMDELPNILADEVLFKISDSTKQSNVLKIRIQALDDKSKSIKEQIDLIQRYTKTKQKRLQKIREIEDQLKLFNENRILRQDRWLEEEYTYLNEENDKVSEFREFIELKSEKISSTGFPTVNTNELQTLVEETNEITNDTSSSSKKGGWGFKKKKSKGSNRGYKSLKKESFSEALKNRESSLSQSDKSSPPQSKNLVVQRSSTSPSNIDSGLLIVETKTPEQFEKLLEEEFEKRILFKKIESSTEKINRIQEQLDLRKKNADSLTEKSNTAASGMSRDFEKYLKEQREICLEELRDLLATESTLSVQCENISKELKQYEECLKKIQEEKNDKKNLNHHKIIKSESIFDALQKSIHAFQCYISLLLDKFRKNLPRSETINQNSVNIWQEPLITNGRNKTVIYSKEVDQSNFDIRAGTLNQLVMRLTDESKAHLVFLKTFIATYQSFTTPDLLFQKLVERYNVPRDQQYDISDEDWKTNIVLPIQFRVSNVIRKWLDQRFPDFDYKLMRKLNDFIDTHLRRDGHHLQVDSLAGSIKRQIEKQQELSFGRKLTSGPTGTGISCEILLTTPSMKLAKHITAIDSQVYRSIHAYELCDHLISKRCTNITKMVDRFNIMSNWISFMIVTPETAADRAKVYSKFVEIGCCLRSLNNFSGLLSLTSGLKNTCIHRLIQTQELISQQIQDDFKVLTNLMSPDKSFKEYREALHSASPPVVPYIGVYLGNLTFINDGNPNTIDGLINFRKCELMYTRVIEEFLQYQQAPYEFELDEQLSLKLSNIRSFTEDELMELSSKREPR